MFLESLFLLATVAVLLGAAIVLIIALLTRKRRIARNALLILLIWLGVYAIALLGVSFLTPQTMLPLHQERCFDEMCFSVTQVTTMKTIGTEPHQQTTHGIYYLVTVQLRNASLRTPQKPDSPSFTLVDAQGQSYSPSPDAQQTIGQEPRWDQQLQPGAVESRTVIFAVPGVLPQPGLLLAEGGWPSSLVIGDDNSFFHKKTEVRLSP